MTPEKVKEMNDERALDRGYEQAFPLTTGNGYIVGNGLSKREYMATQLMAGMLAQGLGSDVAADCAVRAVDNLLIALHVNT